MGRECDFEDLDSISFPNFSEIGKDLKGKIVLLIAPNTGVPLTIFRILGDENQGGYPCEGVQVVLDRGYTESDEMSFFTWINKFFKEDFKSGPLEVIVIPLPIGSHKFTTIGKTPVTIDQVKDQIFKASYTRGSLVQLPRYLISNLLELEKNFTTKYSNYLGSLKNAVIDIGTNQESTFIPQGKVESPRSAPLFGRATARSMGGLKREKKDGIIVSYPGELDELKNYSIDLKSRGFTGVDAYTSINEYFRACQVFVKKTSKTCRILTLFHDNVISGYAFISTQKDPIIEELNVRPNGQDDIKKIIHKAFIEVPGPLKINPDLQIDPQDLGFFAMHAKYLYDPETYTFTPRDD